MQQHFIIHALPRSGTAWVAQLLSTIPGVLCWHELVQHGDIFKTEEEALTLPGYTHTGDCTTFVTQAEDELDAKRVWIHRDSEECLASYAYVYGEKAEDSWGALMKDAEAWLVKFKPVEINFDLLHSEKIDLAWEEACLLVESCGLPPLPYEKWLILRKLNVQIHDFGPDYYKDAKFIGF
jgi:hypothetical protein